MADKKGREAELLELQKAEESHRELLLQDKDERNKIAKDLHSLRRCGIARAFTFSLLEIRCTNKYCGGVCDVCMYVLVPMIEQWQRFVPSFLIVSLSVARKRAATVTLQQQTAERGKRDVFNTVLNNGLYGVYRYAIP